LYQATLLEQYNIHKYRRNIMNKTERMQMVMEALQKTSFTQMPSFAHSTVQHKGGLLQHSLNYWLQLEEITERMGVRWKHPSSPFVIAMLHHACDIGRYFYNHDYHIWETNEVFPAGHGALSVQFAEKLGIELTEEEKACIKYHTGDYVEEELWKEYPKTLAKYPNIAWAQVADSKLKQYYGGLL
jgi:hypothetical protein